MSTKKRELKRKPTRFGDESLDFITIKKDPAAKQVKGTAQKSKA